MSEKQKQLVEGILSDSYEMSEAYRQRLIGVAYGLEISQGPGMAKDELFARAEDQGT